MDNFIKVKIVEVQKGRIDIRFDISSNLKSYFKQTTFWYEMESIEMVPQSISVIPFVCNVLPVVWLTDCSLVLDSLDQVFYQCIDDIKLGYAAMYPMLDFKGKVVCDRLENNEYKASHSVVMFSGGIDAICTTIRHLPENPLLLSIWGSADFPINATDSWHKQWDNLQYNAGKMELDCYCIKSNFCGIFNLWSPGLMDLIRDSGETWWHGFQHGIGILSHSAPFCYVHKCRMSYIASSYHESQRPFTCASDPTIDSKMKFASTDCFHDAFELTRQNKVALIVEYAKKHSVKFNIHVCLRQNQQDNNCCKCEKCYRTILELLLEGAEPNCFGFDNYNLNNVIEDIQYKMYIPFTAIPFYKDMQNIIKSNSYMGETVRKL